MHPRHALVCALLAAASCRTVGDAPSQPAAPTTTTTSPQIPTAAVGAKLSPPSAGCSPARQSPSARLILERSMCYGYCPDYTVEVHGDGQAIYEGRDFVRVRGKRTGRIPQAQVDALFAEAACAHPEGWKSNYTYPVTDNPSATVTVDLAGDGAPPIVVRDYPPCHQSHDPDDTPAELCELEKAIDTTFGSDAYVQCVGPDGGFVYCTR